MRAALIVTLVLVVSALAGCAKRQAQDGPPDPVASLERLLEALYDPDGRFAHEPAFAKLALDAAIDAAADRRITTSATFERGLDGLTRDTALVSGAQAPVELVTYCDASGYHTAVLERVYHSRPVAGVACGAGRIAGGPPEDVAAYTLTSSRMTEEGGVNATFGFVVQGQAHNATLVADAKGRPTSLHLTRPGVVTTMTITYAPRQPLVVPADTDRLPADITGHESATGDALLWVVDESLEPQPLDEFSIRAHDGKDGALHGEFDPSRPSPQVSGALTFTFDDADGDGRLSAGDRASVQRDGAYPDGASLVVWDEWARKDLSDRGVSLA